MRSQSGSIRGLLFAMTVWTVSPTVADEGPTSARQVEIFRYEVAPRVVLDRGAQIEVSATMPFGDPGVDAYLVVVRLRQGERFVSARAAVRDGFICIPRRGRAKGIAGRIAARLAYQLAIHSVRPEFHEPLSLISELLPTSTASPVPSPRLKQRIQLKAMDVEHHEGYVAFLLLVAANPVTRIHIDRVVTRSDAKSRKRRSKEARTVALPDESETTTRSRIMSILSGEEDERFHRPRF